ncbi:MAG TPA: hypothetical protein H9913_03135 [Candidatus Blautia stercoripullorum]|uniref:Lipoprotein n=1 Tax=Candidatus Blautia stercoripullorum TaxID=2838502 RepID=A0A9D2R5T1_9FIRM|nr:hypothetical protein [Candidatus Blautia stercoripullorum]
MKKYLGLVLGSLLLAGCGMADFNGSRTGNESQFLMEYTIFNTTDSQLLELKKGEQIHGEIEKISGKLAVSIQQEGKAPILESKDMPSGSFDLEIEEDGKYRITVTGERAKGSVSFTKE